MYILYISVYIYVYIYIQKLIKNKTTILFDVSPIGFFRNTSIFHVQYLLHFIGLFR